MTGLYNYATVYHVTAENVSPLRTGSMGGLPEEILCDHEGRPLIQGSSIAGAMREWVSKSPFSDLEVPLFGSRRTDAESIERGMLIISDGMFSSSETAQISLRPRLKIDGKTGAAADGAKFSVSAVPPGNIFNFRVTLLEQISDPRNRQAVEQVLSAMNSGQIALGAQKTNGYGLVSVSVKRRIFDMSIQSDLNAWLDDSDDSVQIQLPYCEPANRVVFRITGKFPTVLVKAEEKSFRDKCEYSKNIYEGCRPIIPGSSIKGAVRSRIKAISDLLHPGEGDKYANAIFGCGEGDTGTPGNVYFSDAILGDSRASMVRRIKINKFTGGVFGGGLFCEEPETGTAEFTVSAPNDNLICGLLFFALRDLCAGAYSLGSGCNIGWGYFSGGNIKIEISGRAEAEMSFGGPGKVMLTDPDNTVDRWIKSLGGEGHG